MVIVCGCGWEPWRVQEKGMTRAFHYPQLDPCHLHHPVSLALPRRKKAERDKARKTADQKRALQSVHVIPLVA